MSKTIRTLIPLLLGLLSVSSDGAGDEASRLEGRWQIRYSSSQVVPYEIQFSGDRFDSMHGDARYQGEVVIDAEADPARIDFTIRECECGFLDKTSKAIFRWDGDVIEVRAPPPGEPRPTEFDEKDDETFRLVREGG